MFLNYLRYFGMNSLIDFERMTIHEYQVRMTACELKKLDDMELIHIQAWKNWQVQATKTQGKREVSYYQSFDKFFNKKERENEIMGIIEHKKTDSKLIDLMKKANELERR